MKTHVIAGKEITLEIGRWYCAVRPMLTNNTDKNNIPVWIRDRNCVVVVVFTMTYDESNEFLKEFNNGKISFTGRIWR